MSSQVQLVPTYVHVGSDGWLFLMHGSNNVIAQFEHTAEMRSRRWEWRAALADRERRLRAMGILYRHIFVPEKLSIYDNKVNGLNIDPKGSPAYRIYRQDPYYSLHPIRGLNISRLIRRRRRWRRTLIDLVEPMRQARDGADLFYRTDSHWTFEGRLIAYRAVCEAFDVRPALDLGERRGESILRWAGDLGAACVPPITERATWRHVDRDAVRVYASPIVEHRERIGQSQTLHNGSYVIYRNELSPDPRTMVLFGDSYSHVQPIMLTAMLAETFRELHFVWSTSIDYKLIERVKPDIVLSEMAERFMYRLPDDDNFDIEIYARERFGDELAAAGF